MKAFGDGTESEFVLVPGPQGKSAYQLWLEAGNSGTVEDFFEAERGPAGPASTVPGPVGPAVQITVGSIQTGPPGAGSSFTLVPNSDHTAYTANIILERGATGNPGGAGPAGAAPTVSVVSPTITLPAGQNATAALIGSDPTNVRIQFAIPQGAVGPTGHGLYGKGLWQPAYPYEIDFYASYNGSLYRRVTAGLSRATFDSTEAANWSLEVSKGDTGNQGPTGLTGPIGMTMTGLNWAPSTAYTVGQAVQVVRAFAGETTKSTIYCAVAHTSPAGSYSAVTEAANWIVIAQGGGTPVAAITATPASVLNIGSANGQNHYSLQYGPTPPGNGTTVAAVAVSQSAFIAASFVPPAEVQVTADGRRVALRTRIDAPVTSGSVYPRAELQENGLTGAKNAFDPMTGTHWQRHRYRITHLPLKNGGVKPEVVVAQLHNNNNDVVAVRTQVVVSPNDGSRSLHLVVRINGTNNGAIRLASPPVVGQEYDVMIKLTEGLCEIYHALAGDPAAFTQPVWTTDPFQATGSTYLTNALGYDWAGAHGSPLVSGAQTPAWYFKAGQYVQTNPSIENCTDAAPYNAPVRRMYSTNSADTIVGDPKDYFEVEMSRLQHWHSTWPQPQYIDYGAQVPGPIGLTGAAAQIQGVAAVTIPVINGVSQPATAANLGTADQAILQIGVPVGSTGATGATGLQGNPGRGIQSVGVNNQYQLIITYTDASAINAGTLPQGVGVASATINNQDHLILTLTNAVTLDAGNVRGPVGLTGASAYQAWLALGNAGSTADFITSLRGATGATGPTGPAGQKNVFYQQNSPGALGYPYFWYHTDSSGALTNELTYDDGTP